MGTSYLRKRALIKRFQDHRGNARSKQGDHLKKLRLEPLESRQLLSATVTSVSIFDCLPKRTASGGITDANSPVGYTPVQIATAYGLNQISINGITGNGAGQTIAVIDAYDDPYFISSNNSNFNTSDLYKFDAQFSDLQVYSKAGAPKFYKLNEYGVNGSYPSQGTADWQMEESLDVEWVHAIAPEANIVMIEANNGIYSVASFDDMMTAIKTAANLNTTALGIPPVSVISMSFGFSESWISQNVGSGAELSNDSDFTTPSGHIPITFLASSGDDGAPAGYPAYSPNVVAVGGTTLTLNAQNQIVTETGWGNPTYPNDGSSSGGISAYESQPSYQNGVVTQSTTKRTAPDVSADADPMTGYAVYDTYDGGSNPWVEVGGTSASCPVWAGFIGIVDQELAAEGQSTLNGRSQLLPDLYAIAGNATDYAADFHDIQKGTSLGTPEYNAAKGYDLVTGIGSPVANQLANVLVNPIAAVAAATPNPVTEGNSVTLNATGSVDQIGGTIKTYEWSLTDNSTYQVVSTASSSTVLWSTLYSAGINRAGTYNIKLEVVDNEGNVGFATTTLTVSYVAPTLSMTGSSTTTENSLYTLDIKATSPGNDPIASFTVTWGDGNVQTINGPWTPSSSGITIPLTHTYAYVYTGSDTHTITATYTDNGQTQAVPGSVSVTVSEAAPVVQPISGATTIILGQTAAFSASFADGGSDSATWDWGDPKGDTSAGTVNAGNNSVSGSHTYANPGTYTITLTVQQSDGTQHLSSQVTKTVTVTPVGLVQDPLNAAQWALVVVGGAGVNNTILVGVTGVPGQVQVAVNGVGYGVYTPTGHIIVYGGGNGNDTITVSSKVSLPCWLIDGNGKDTLTGGSGRNILIAGSGSDNLYGGSSDDLIVSGTSSLFTGSFSTVEANVTAIAKEWESSDSAAQRVAYLTGAQSGGQNGSVVLKPGVTIFSKSAVDTIFGGGGNDLIFANLNAAKPYKALVVAPTSSEYFETLD